MDAEKEEKTRVTVRLIHHILSLTWYAKVMIERTNGRCVEQWAENIAEVTTDEIRID